MRHRLRPEKTRSVAQRQRYPVARWLVPDSGIRIAFSGTRLGYGVRATERAGRSAFHDQTHLLAEALFTTVEQNQTPVTWSYSDYAEFSGLILPTRVEQVAGDNLPSVYTIESIDFAPSFGPGHFDFQ